MCQSTCVRLPTVRWLRDFRGRAGNQESNGRRAVPCYLVTSERGQSLRSLATLRWLTCRVPGALARGESPGEPGQHAA